MSLQIRRGTEAQRTGVIFDSGEIIFTTDTQKLYVGDGITAGGKNVLATSAGGGVTFNNTTQTFDFTTTGLGLTTSVVSEGTNLYHTRQRAQDDAAALFTATGAPSSVGNITATSAPNTVSISGSTATMQVGERFIVTGSGGNGLTGSPTTYYVAQVVSGSSIKLATTRLNALAGTPLVTVTANASYAGTSYAAGGESSNVVFTYDSVNHTMVANVTLDGIGITSVQADTAPALGGNLDLNSRSITGTGAISVTSGNISTSSGTMTATSLNSNQIFAPGGTVTFGSNSTTANVSIIADTSVSSNPALSIRGLTSGTAGPGQITTTLRIKGSKGTLASPTVLATGDNVGLFGFNGYINGGASGALNADVGGIICSLVSGGDLVSNFAKAKIDIILANDTNPSNIARATFYSSGVFQAPIFQATSYTTTTMNAIASPAAGMIVFNSTVNHFYGFNGTTWVAFTGP